MPSIFSNRSGYSMFPPFIKFLLVTNVAVYLAQAVFLAGLTFKGTLIDNVAMELLALWPFGNGFLPWQLLTYQYLHGSLGHLFFNMFALWMFGMELENVWGTKRFALYYTLSGIAAGIVHLLVSPALRDLVGPTVGASGSIMGVLLAFGLTFPTRPVMMFPIFFPIPARIFVLIYAGFDLFFGLMNTSDGVAHFAHLGGALGGYLLLKFGAPLFRMIDRDDPYRPMSAPEDQPIDVQYRDVPRYEEPARIYPVQNRTVTPTKFVVDGEPIHQETIDDILDKISQAGYHSLTEHEKKILFEVSRQL